MREKAKRAKRNRRAAWLSVVATLLIVVAGVTSLWQRSEAARRSAEASQLMTLGRSQLGHNPTAALTYAIASLERADDASLRRFALEALWDGPIAHQLHSERFNAGSVAFSPDGKWMAIGSDSGQIELWSGRPSEPDLLVGHQGVVVELQFATDSDLLISYSEAPAEVRVWSVADAALERVVPIEDGSRVAIAAQEPSLLIFQPSGQSMQVSSLSLRRDISKKLGEMESFSSLDVDVEGKLLLFSSQGDVYSARVDDVDLGALVRLGAHPTPVREVTLSSDGLTGVSFDETDEIRLWSVDQAQPNPWKLIHGPTGTSAVQFDSSGSKLAVSSNDKTVRLYDLTKSAAVEPLLLRRGDVLQMNDSLFSPDGSWVATMDAVDVALWHLGWPLPETLRGHNQRVTAVDFSTGGDWLASASSDGSVRLWSTGSDPSVEDTLLYESSSDQFVDLDVDPKGRFVSVSGSGGQVLVVPTDGRPPQSLKGFTGQVYAVACDPTGRWIAASGGQKDPSEAVIRMWDLESDETRLLDPGDGLFISDLAFLSDGRLISAGFAPIRLWDPETALFEDLHELPAFLIDVSEDDRHLLAVGADFGIRLLDLEQGTQMRPTGHGAPDRPSVIAISSDSNQIASGDFDGTVRVGGADDVAPHLFLGHKGSIYTVAFASSGRWLATGGDDGTIRVWPVPEGPPFSTLSTRDAISFLETQTNLRVTADSSDPSGYSLTVEPFQGWEQ